MQVIEMTLSLPLSLPPFLSLPPSPPLSPSLPSSPLSLSLPLSPFLPSLSLSLSLPLFLLRTRDDYNTYQDDLDNINKFPRSKLRLEK